MHSLKDDTSIIVKGAGRRSVVVFWEREDYLRETYGQLDDKEVYGQVPNNAIVLANTLMKVLEKNSSAGKFVEEHSWLFFNKRSYICKILFGT